MIKKEDLKLINKDMGIISKIENRIALKNIDEIIKSTDAIMIARGDLALDIGKTIQHAERIMDEGCNGVVFFGSTGQSQLISLGEKINLINQLSTNKNKGDI